jgi:hypothetical protein
VVDKLESKGVTLRILNFGGDAVDMQPPPRICILRAKPFGQQFLRQADSDVRVFYLSVDGAGWWRCGAPGAPLRCPEVQNN